MSRRERSISEHKQGSEGCQDGGRAKRRSYLALRTCFKMAEIGQEELEDEEESGPRRGRVVSQPFSADASAPA